MNLILSLAVLASSKAPMILAHYMPWYESKPVSGHWGWHWNMNRFDPDHGTLASHYRPLIGLYDSSDPDVLDCQCIQMKMAGISGVLIDWYGMDEVNDYAIIHRNTSRMIEAADRAGLKYALVFEDQIVPQLISHGKTTAAEAVPHIRAEVSWLGEHWFRRPGYLRVDGKPLFLVFGPQYFKEADWPSIFSGLNAPPAFVAQLGRRAGAMGGFGWPEPQVGDAKSWNQVRGFYDRGKDWPIEIGVAYPRFVDIYEHSYGRIEDRDGKTYADTLDLALRRSPSMVQVATWNDWGEGTQIEPSVEFGYRDLIATQKASSVAGRFTPADFALTVKWLELKRRYPSGPKASDLKRVYSAWISGDSVRGRILMAQIS